MASCKKRVGASARRQRGAALLLLLMLMGVSAASLLVSALSHGTQEARRAEQTVFRLAQVSDALIGYAVSHGRLPRPALSATDGRENPALCGSEDSCTGFVPWVTLGVEPADAWGKLLRYSVTPAFTRAPILRVTTVATKTLSTRNNDGALRYLVGQNDCNAQRQCAPFIVLSHGRNNFGTSVAGIAQAASGGGVDEQLNASSATRYISRVASADDSLAGGAFDDIVRAVALAALYKQMGAAGALP